jgi:hypothetical protein
MYFRRRLAKVNGDSASVFRLPQNGTGAISGDSPARFTPKERIVFPSVGHIVRAVGMPYNPPVAGLTAVQRQLAIQESARAQIMIYAQTR